jgi:hypothetical protein
VDAGPCAWTAVHSTAPQFEAEWTPVDTDGHRLEIYGSGGWVFESPRARR